MTSGQERADEFRDGLSGCTLIWAEGRHCELCGWEMHWAGEGSGKAWGWLGRCTWMPLVELEKQGAASQARGE